MIELFEEDYETIKSTLMITICEKKKGNIANLNEIIESYQGYHKEEVVKKSIDRYGKENGFYDVMMEERILTENGIKECQKQMPGQS